MAGLPATGPTAAALQAYRAAAGAASAEPSPTVDFAGMVENALKGTVDTAHATETQATQGIAGQGNLLDVVYAVSRAELSLQTTVAIRDRVVQAYQDIMRMPI